MNNVKIIVTIWALCLSLAVANPIQMLPHDSYGDLNMPGFLTLNQAINSGSLDMSPSLATMYTIPKKTLGEVIYTVLGDLAKFSRVHGDLDVAASLKSLQDVSYEFEQIAMEHGKVPESWGMVESLSGYSIATITLRTQLQNSVEVVQMAVLPLIDATKQGIIDLGTGPELLAVQQQVETLILNFNTQFSKQVSNTAQVLRDITRLLSDILNYRIMQPQDLEMLEASVAQMTVDLNTAITQLTEQITAIKAELAQLEMAGIVERYELLYIAANVSQISNLLARERGAMTVSIGDMVKAAHATCEALHAFI